MPDPSNQRSHAYDQPMQKNGWETTYLNLLLAVILPETRVALEFLALAAEPAWS
jgi:hypothetical protein